MIHKARLTLHQCRFFYLSGFILLLGMKLFYAQADSNDLKWILAPTARWVQILTGIPFEHDGQLGYISHSFRFIIAPSCSGVQFILVVFATCFYSFIHRPNNRRLKFFWMGSSLIFSYLFTIFVNGIRITLAIYIPNLLTTAFSSDIYKGWITPESLHTGIGTVVYFISILVAYRFAQFAIQRLTLPQSTESLLPDTLPQSSSNPCMLSLKKYISPIFWYFFIVLGIPLLNRIRIGNLSGYKTYARFIICICLSVLFLAWLIEHCFIHFAVRRCLPTDNDSH